MCVTILPIDQDKDLLLFGGSAMTYKPGKIVPITGTYQCIHCKTIKHFDKGDRFTPCGKHGCNQPEWKLVHG